jgi:hypothetical protein
MKVGKLDAGGEAPGPNTNGGEPVSLPRTRRLPAAMACALLLASAAPTSAEEGCVQCHESLRNPILRAPVDDRRQSVHYAPGVGCSDCHGGNPRASTVGAHRTADFLSRIQASSMPEVCGTCHGDESRFAESQLPTDQLTGYRLSVHGEAFAAGNWRAASCWDCHGNHLVLSPRDPGSRVHPANVADTCGGCHSSREVMEGSELPTDQERKWRQSVHGKAHAKWLAEGGPTGEEEAQDHPPTCNDCHGEHAMAAPEHAVQACIGCHEDAWEAFRNSPHQEPFERKGFLPCVECHGSHDVRSVDASLVGIDHDAACRRCHRAGQEMALTIGRLAQLQEQAEAEVRKARFGARGGNGGAEHDEALALLEQRERALRIAIHSLDEERIRTAAQALMDAASRVRGRQAEVSADDAVGRRLRHVAIGSASMACLGLLALILGRWVRK